MNTQTNFCRLTGITQEEYQNVLFESGYLYADSYWSKHLSDDWITFSKVMRETKEYWKWWATQWNIRTQEAFGVAGINENEKQISMEKSNALIEAFIETHSENSYENIYPNNLVMKSLKQKIYGSNKTLIPNTIKGVERNRLRKSSISIKL